MLSQTLGPMIEASDGSGIPTARIIDVSRAVALEIGECDLLLIPSCRLTGVIIVERAAGPGAEMSVKFCDVKLSVGAKTSISLQFTRERYHLPQTFLGNASPRGVLAAGIVTVNLGLIELPSLVQRGEGVAPEHGTPAESGQGGVAVEEANAPHLTTLQSNALARNPSFISSTFRPSSHP